MFSHLIIWCMILNHSLTNTMNFIFVIFDIRQTTPLEDTLIMGYRMMLTTPDREMCFNLDTVYI